MQKGGGDEHHTHTYRQHNHTNKRASTVTDKQQAFGLYWPHLHAHTQRQYFIFFLLCTRNETPVNRVCVHRDTARVGGAKLEHVVAVTRTRTNALWYCYSVLQCVAVHCSVWQLFQSTALDSTQCGTWQCVAVCCSVLQCVAVCCSVLQCVAVCCSVLQCVAVCSSQKH